MALVLPFRDRQEHLDALLPQITDYLQVAASLQSSSLRSPFHTRLLTATAAFCLHLSLLATLNAFCAVSDLVLTLAQFCCERP